MHTYSYLIMPSVIHIIQHWMTGKS